VKILEKYISEFERGRDFAVDDAEPLLDALIASDDEATLARVFRAWDQKDIASDEIFQFARIMRERCTRVDSGHVRTVDIVGTGGSSNKTFNVSTAAAFVIAGCNVPVAKHGNKAATSNSGSADVLEELGVDYAADAATAERCLSEIGICFMFAPKFHRLSPTLAKVRRGLGFPTIFNCVGPLCNPANAQHSLIGVWKEDLVMKMAEALAQLGTDRSWVVHGRNGVDEVSIAGTTVVAEITDRSIKHFQLEPADYGVEPRSTDEIRVGTAAESASLVRGVLAGEQPGSAAESIVLLNAAAALHIYGRADSIGEGMNIARASIEGGAALTKLNHLAKALIRI
jgi:anthranilate phosphoribosyltransferase